MMTNRCRFQWHPKSISFFLAVGVALSIYSSVDCRLVSVGKIFWYLWNSIDRWQPLLFFRSPFSVSRPAELQILIIIISSDDFSHFSDLGFQPKHYNTNTIEIGLWSFESPDGSCARHVNDNNNNGTIQEGYLWITDWSKWFINDDFSWTTSRIFALTGVVFGNISLVSAWFV